MPSSSSVQTDACHTISRDYKITIKPSSASKSPHSHPTLHLQSTHEIEGALHPNVADDKGISEAVVSSLEISAHNILTLEISVVVDGVGINCGTTEPQSCFWNGILDRSVACNFLTRVGGFD